MSSLSRASFVYRVAAVVLLLFAIGHTFSFSQTDPSWGLDPTLASMRSIHFSIAGTERTYWDLFMASGLTVGLLYLFSAVLAWRLGTLRPETRRELRVVCWAFALAYAAVTAVSVVYLFPIPSGFSGVVTLLLITGAWESSRQEPAKQMPAG